MIDGTTQIAHKAIGTILSASANSALTSDRFRRNARIENTMPHIASNTLNMKIPTQSRSTSGPPKLVPVVDIACVDLSRHHAARMLPPPIATATPPIANAAEDHGIFRFGLSTFALI